MIRDVQAVLFSAKCFAAAMLAYYVALSIGLNRPFWAVVTSYIIAQPLAGAVLSKAVFRLIGTVLGATVAVILLPAFANEPVVLCLALAAWLGLCVYLAQLDRTPRAYVFVLAGYTASIIGIPSVDTPGTIFTTAILRVQEITIGISCASLVHGVVFPRSVTAQLLARIDTILADACRWSQASLAGTREAGIAAERRRLAVDVLDLHQLSVHLPFDTARILPRVRTVRALQDRLSLLLPLASTVEDRLAELADTPGGVPAPIAGFVAAIESWIGTDLPLPDREETATVLLAEARRLEPLGEHAPEHDLIWRDMVLLNLLSRLGELVGTLRDLFMLRDQIRAPHRHAVSPRVADLLRATSARSLHLDRGLALRCALATMTIIGIGCTFWIATAWREGGGAVLIAGIACALFGGMADPRAAIGRMQLGSTIGLIASILYGYTILPRVTDFVTLAAALAPMLLLMGCLMGKAETAAVGTGIMLGFPQTVGLNATYVPAFGSAINGAIAQFVGIGFSMTAVTVFLTIGVESRMGRFARAAWRDVARRARGHAPDNARWVGRMLDRVGLMLPAMAVRASPGTPLLDALTDLRVGFVAGELHRLALTASAEERALVADTLGGIAAHFGSLRPTRISAPAPAILADIDHAVSVFARDGKTDRRRDGLILLTSLRRNLFPAAPAYGEAP